MKDLFIVFKFELLNQLKKKSVIITTIALAVILFVATSIPTIIKFFDNGATKDPVVENPNDPAMKIENSAYYFVNKADIEKVRTVVKIDEQDLYESEENLKENILDKDKEYKVGFVIHSLTEYKTIYNDRGISSYESTMLNEALRQVNIVNKLSDYDISYQDYQALQTIEISETQEVLGKDGTSNMFMTYFMIIMIYLIISLYGSTISTNIAREKDSRTMELLITSVKPSSLILGKVAAMGLAAILQLALVILGGVVGFFLSRSNYPDMIMMVVKSSLAVDTLIVYLVYFIIGYTLYLFMYASMGSVVSKVEDVSSAIGPIMFVFMIGYFISFVAMELPDNIVVKIGSWVPFSSLIVMPTRYPLTTIPLIEMVFSIGLLLVTTAFFAYISIKIYRMGSLNYGNKISFFKAIKMVLTKER